MKDNLNLLLSFLDLTKVKLDEPLSKHTTLKIGGPADILFQPTNTTELISAVKKARELNIPITMLGWGANILIGDRGIRGLVIRNNSKNITIGDEGPIVEEDADDEEIIALWASASEESGGRAMYEFKDLDYKDDDNPIVEVVMDSGVDLPFAMNHLVNKGITGLQWYGRIPGTIGGCIYNNIHGGTHFFHEIIKDVTVLDKDNVVKKLSRKDLDLGYDESRFHKTNEIILEATFNLRKGDSEKAKAVMLEWTRRKGKLQPGNSCGCIFKNISLSDQEKLGYPTCSVGFLVEHILGLSGFHVGDAHISKGHHNFIENKGKATAEEYLSVINKIKTKAKEIANLDLELEIFLLGEF